MSWIEDQNQKHKFARDYAIFTGSFTNPEAAKKMHKNDDPDYALSEEEWEESWQRVVADQDKVISINGEVKKEDQGKIRHRRRGIKKVIK